VSIYFSECLTKGSAVVALWYKTSQEIFYVRGYVKSMDDETLTVVPHDRHKSLMHGSLLVTYKGNTDQVFKDEIPQHHQISIGQHVLAMTHKDGQPVYQAGDIKNILGSHPPWYQISLYGSSTVWRRNHDLRLKNIPKHCDIASSYKIEIKRH